MKPYVRNAGVVGLIVITKMVLDPKINLLGLDGSADERLREVVIMSIAITRPKLQFSISRESTVKKPKPRVLRCTICKNMQNSSPWLVPRRGLAEMQSDRFFKCFLDNISVIHET